VENGAHTSECMSNGFVVRLVLTFNDVPLVLGLDTCGAHFVVFYIPINERLYDSRMNEG
jgi:hypothetical protein